MAVAGNVVTKETIEEMKGFLDSAIEEEREESGKDEVLCGVVGFCCKDSVMDLDGKKKCIEQMIAMTDSRMDTKFRSEYGQWMQEELLPAMFHCCKQKRKELMSGSDPSKEAAAGEEEAFLDKKGKQKEWREVALKEEIDNVAFWKKHGMTKEEVKAKTKELDEIWRQNLLKLKKDQDESGFCFERWRMRRREHWPEEDVDWPGYGIVCTKGVRTIRAPVGATAWRGGKKEEEKEQYYMIVGKTPYDGWIKYEGQITVGAPEEPKENEKVEEKSDEAQKVESEKAEQQERRDAKPRRMSPTGDQKLSLMKEEREKEGVAEEEGGFKFVEGIVAKDASQVAMVVVEPGKVVVKDV